MRLWKHRYGSWRLPRNDDQSQWKELSARLDIWRGQMNEGTVILRASRSPLICRVLLNNRHPVQIAAAFRGCHFRKFGSGRHQLLQNEKASRNNRTPQETLQLIENISCFSLGLKQKGRDGHHEQCPPAAEAYPDVYRYQKEL